MKSLNLKEYGTFLLSLVFFLVLIIVLYFKFDKIVDITKYEFENIVLNQLHHNALVIEKNLLKKNFKQLPKDTSDIDAFLSTFVGEEYKYVYIIYQDRSKNFRYFADGSLNEDEKGEYGQIFFPLEEKEWRYAFERNIPIHFIQNKIDTLWITYLFPLKIIKDIKTFLVLDVSIEPYKRMESLLSNLREFLKYLIFFLSIIFAFILMLYIFVYKEYKKSYMDALTNVYTRAFLNKIESDINLNKYAIAMIDIDYFKKINDTYGHDIGDLVLKNVASLILKNIKKEDILIRYGGEEFLLFLKKDGDVIRRVERIHRAIADSFISISNLKINVTVSIGLNLIPDMEKSLADAIKKADMKLYEAKTHGRNRIEILKKEQQNNSFISMNFEVITSLISNKALELHFQPIVDIKKNKISKFEALARLKYNDSLIYPNIFLPVILRTNFYIDFTVLVLNKVFEEIDKYRIEISVNFTRSDFLDKKLIQKVMDIIKDNPDKAKFLVLEILENEEIQGIDMEFFHTLHKLKELGCKIALDDFGSGYSNLNYFLNIEPDIVKIDGSIIKEITNNKNAVKIVKSIAIFSKYINAKTVAEFVENKEILDIIKELGIDYAQGYYFGKPVKDISQALLNKI